MTSEFTGSVFAMEVDGKPTFVFEAKNFREAFELCKEDWLRADLIGLTSNGVPLCTPKAKLTVRKADEIEAQIYRQAGRQVQSDDLVLAYLVDLDHAGATFPQDDPE
jgi:hypothetical protein